MIKIISVAKLDKGNCPILNTQNSNNACENKFVLSDGLPLLMNKLSFNSSKCLLDSLSRNLKIFMHYFLVTNKHVILYRG